MAFCVIFLLNAKHTRDPHIPTRGMRVWCGVACRYTKYILSTIPDEYNDNYYFCYKRLRPKLLLRWQRIYYDNNNNK